MLKTMNTCTKFLSKLDKNWPSYEQNTIYPYLPGIFQNLSAKFFKGLTQNSTQKLKVEIQLYVDSENFMKKY